MFAGQGRCNTCRHKQSRKSCTAFSITGADENQIGAEHAPQSTLRRCPIQVEIKLATSSRKHDAEQARSRPREQAYRWAYART